MKFAVSGRKILLRVVLLSSFACMGLLLSQFTWEPMLVFIILHHLVRYIYPYNFQVFLSY